MIAHSGIGIGAKIGNLNTEINWQRKANAKSIAEFQINKEMHTIVYVRSGGLILRNCLLSLRSLPKNLKFKVASLVAMPQTQVNMVNCEFMGNDYNMTSACVFLNSHAVISSCKFQNFRSGAILSVAN